MSWQIYLHVKEGKVVKATGVEDMGPNFGSLCVKARFGYDFIDHPDGLKTPLIRDNGNFGKASWDEALKYVSENFRNRVEAFAEVLKSGA